VSLRTYSDSGMICGRTSAVGAFVIPFFVQHFSIFQNFLNYDDKDDGNGCSSF
jgi:hypothetical protein